VVNFFHRLPAFSASTTNPIVIAGLVPANHSSAARAVVRHSLSDDSASLSMRSLVDRWIAGTRPAMTKFLVLGHWLTDFRSLMRR
jgi:hypothetical protein